MKRHLTKERRTYLRGKYGWGGDIGDLLDDLDEADAEIARLKQKVERYEKALRAAQHLLKDAVHVKKQYRMGEGYVGTSGLDDYRALIDDALPTQEEQQNG